MTRHLDVDFPTLPIFKTECATWTWGGKNWKPVITPVMVLSLTDTFDGQAAMKVAPPGVVTIVHSKTQGSGAILTLPGTPRHTPADRESMILTGKS